MENDSWDPVACLLKLRKYQKLIISEYPILNTENKENVGIFLRSGSPLCVRHWLLCTKKANWRWTNNKLTLKIQVAIHVRSIVSLTCLTPTNPKVTRILQEIQPNTLVTN